MGNTRYSLHFNWAWIGFSIFQTTPWQGSFWGYNLPLFSTKCLKWRLMFVRRNLLLWSTLCFTVFAVDKYTYSYMLWQCRQACKGNANTNTYILYINISNALHTWFDFQATILSLVFMLTSWSSSNLFCVQLVGWPGMRMVKRQRRSEGGKVLGTSLTMLTPSLTILTPALTIPI